jgi:hypothetical protein
MNTTLEPPRELSYAEKLHDPRWQIKRLRIFERDSFACQFCGDKTKELQVHHLDYCAGLEPWEYRDDWLVTACCDCHKAEKHRKQIEREFIAALRTRGVPVCGVGWLSGAVKSHREALLQMAFCLTNGTEAELAKLRDQTAILTVAIQGRIAEATRG